MDAGRLKQLAARGHFGYAAMLEPDEFVSQVAPALGPPEGQLVAQNATNEFGFSDKMKINLQPESAPASQTSGSPGVRTKAQADLNERLMQQGVPPAEILRREREGK